MLISVENLENGWPCVYAVVFNTGYYYVGSTKSFQSRAKNHIATINYRPEKCEIIVLGYYYEYEEAVKNEREFLIQHNKDSFLLNKLKSLYKLNYINKKLCKTIERLKK